MIWQPLLCSPVCVLFLVVQCVLDDIVSSVVGIFLVLIS